MTTPKQPETNEETTESPEVDSMEDSTAKPKVKGRRLTTSVRGGLPGGDSCNNNDTTWSCTRCCAAV